MQENINLFILGSPRSGTSITYYAMKEVFGFGGRGESHILPIFQKTVHDFFLYTRRFSEMKGTLAQELNFRAYKAHIFQFIRDFYLTTYGTGNWVDKTPGVESIVGVPFILEVFPSAKIIVTSRNGIEVVQSYRKKFSVGFEEACTSWDRCMAALLKVRSNGFNILEVDQYDLTNSPDEISVKIADYLGRSEKAEGLARFFTERRTDQNSAHDWKNRLTMRDTDWSESERETFTRVCGAMMAAFGYEL